MKKTTFTLILSLSFISIFLLFVVITHAMGVSWSNKIVYQSFQGDYVKYCLNIYTQQQTLGSRNFILISRKGDYEYGHYINYPFGNYESEIEKTKVLWTADGVEITFSTGHKMYVPKEKFMAGR